MDGHPGWYRVTFVFAQPGRTVLGDQFDVEEILKTGSSQIKLTTNHLRIFTGDPNIKDAVIHTTTEHRVASAEVEIQGESFLAIENRAHELVGRMLSFLSVFAGQPIALKFTYIHELSTDCMKWAFTSLGGSRGTVVTWPAVPDLNLTGMAAELWVAFANFREGINSFNSFYKLLSFYKVVDYCLGKNKQDARKGKFVSAPSPVTVPGAATGWDGDEIAFITPYAGKSYEEVKEGFRDQIRNAVAHLSPGGNVANPDDLNDIRACQAAIPVMQLIARQMLIDRYDLESKPAVPKS